MQDKMFNAFDWSTAYGLSCEMGHVLIITIPKRLVHN